MESSITLIKVGFVFLEENKRIFESENLFILNSSFGDKEYIFSSFSSVAQSCPTL